MTEAAAPDPRARSLAQAVALAGEDGIEAFIASLSREEKRAFLNDWVHWEQDVQRPPSRPWRVWLLMAGRGFGKTRVGAEWVRQQARLFGNARIALIGATLHEARSVMVEGESGLLAICRGLDERPVWEPSLQRLRWPSGAQAFLYSAAEPESLRGPQHSHAWADEVAKWEQGPAAWMNLEMGMRLGLSPRIVATTTPKPVPLVRRLLADTGTAVTRRRTTDNLAHLPAAFVDSVQATYGGTRLGRQELDGELLEDVDGALWARDTIEKSRRAAFSRQEAERLIARVVIGVDPPAGAGEKADACGIVAVGLGGDGIGYVLGDCSVRGLGPEGWAGAVAAAAERHRADKVVAEANNGGAMVESVLRAAAHALPVKLVHASRGKCARAEPVAALFARGRAKFAGAFPELEDELAGLSIGGRYQGPGRSPDRADAMVWALTELMLGKVQQVARITLL